MENLKNSFNVTISAQTIIKIIVIFLFAYLLYLVRDVIMILFISLVLASAVDPLVDWLQQKKIPRAVGILTIYLVLFLLVALAIYLIAPPIAKEVGDLADNLPQYGNFISESFTSLRDFAMKHSVLSNLSNSLSSFSTNFQGAAGGILATIINVFGGIVSFVLVLFLTFYMVVEEKAMKRLVWVLTPAKNQDYVMKLINRMQKKMGLWLRGQLILCLIIFIMTLPGLLILKVKYALVLALIAALTEAVPYLGPALGAVPAVFLAFTQSPILALFVAIFYYIVQLVENNILVPKVMEKTLGLNPIISIVAFLIGFNIGGIPGAILSIPVATAVSVFIGDVFESRKKGQLEPEF